MSDKDRRKLLEFMLWLTSFKKVDLDVVETIKADERAKIKDEFKIYNRLEAKFTLNQCKEKDGLYYLDVTELFYGLVDQVLGKSKFDAQKRKGRK